MTGLNLLLRIINMKYTIPLIKLKFGLYAINASMTLKANLEKIEGLFVLDTGDSSAILFDNGNFDLSKNVNYDLELDSCGNKRQLAVVDVYGSVSYAMVFICHPCDAYRVL